jgi:IS30 family transposase
MRNAKPKEWAASEKRTLSKLARKGVSVREISTVLRRHVTSIGEWREICG